MIFNGTPSNKISKGATTGAIVGSDAAVQTNESNNSLLTPNATALWGSEERNFTQKWPTEVEGVGRLPAELGADWRIHEVQSENVY